MFVNFKCLHVYWWKLEKNKKRVRFLSLSFCKDYSTLKLINHYTVLLFLLFLIITIIIFIIHLVLSIACLSVCLPACLCGISCVLHKCKVVSYLCWHLNFFSKGFCYVFLCFCLFVFVPVIVIFLYVLLLTIYFLLFFFCCNIGNVITIVCSTCLIKTIFFSKST